MPNDFEIDSEIKFERCSTGITGLDYQLGGGIPVGTSIVVFGNPLAGCDRLAKQFWKADSEESTYLMYDSEVEEGMINARKTNFEGIKPLLTGKRVIIDSLSTMIIKEGIDVALDFITAGIHDLKQQNANVLFILYDGVHDPFEEMRIMRAADIFLSIREEFHQNEIERKLTVHKIPYMDVPSRIYPYIIRDFGLELSTTARVV